MTKLAIAVIIVAAAGLGVAACVWLKPTTNMAAHAPSASAIDPVSGEPKVHKSEAEWRQELTPEQYRVLREKGTERAFTGQYHATKDKGVYRCAACGNELFSSDTKFNSGTGWPSFYAPIADGKVGEHSDGSFGMVRTEVVCARCDSHLGHVFDDGPQPTGLRYCINSICLKLDPNSK